MYLVVCVCACVCSHGGSHVTIRYMTLDLIVQGLSPPRTCSNLFNLDLIVQGSPLNMFKFVHCEAPLASGQSASY